MVNFFEVNKPSHLCQYVKQLRRDFEKVFENVQEVEVGLVFNFPSITDSLSNISMLIFINISYKKGNYFYLKEYDKYVNSLAFGIRFVNDSFITYVGDSEYYTSVGSFDYKEELSCESAKFSFYCHEVLEPFLKNPFFDCQFFDWVKSDNNVKFANDYIVMNQKLNLLDLIKATVKRSIKTENEYKGFNNFYLKDKNNKGIDLSVLIKILINEANERTSLGVLTKKKVDQICKATPNTYKICNSQEKKICIVTGKAGTGKTLALTRAMYEIIKQKKHVRLLTFNNLLVFDIKQYLRNIENVDSKNASVSTLHKFFFNLSKNLRVQALLTRDRVEEVYRVYSERVKLSEQVLYKYTEIYGPEIAKKKLFKFIDEEYKDLKIEISDRQTMIDYLDFIISKPSLKVEERSREYVNKIKKTLEDKLGQKIFLADYNKVLETTYSMLANLKEFYDNNDIKNRHDFLSIIDKTDVVSDEQEEYRLEEFEEFVKKNTKLAKWSNSIIIDEGQDCNLYEKLILMKLRGSENLIVASGGKDQLIRRSDEISWKTDLGKSIPFEEIKLGRKSYRQKGNIVKFINAFNRFFSMPTDLQIAEEFENMGRVIIDISPIDQQEYLEVIKEQRSQGIANGCSPYESMMFLLPSKGYTMKELNEEIHIDENDNVKINNRSFNRKLMINNIPNINIWNGIVENKIKLDVPNQNQTRFLYYDSCRGLEAWSVFCLDLDTFYYSKYSSSDADKYAVEQQTFFTSEEILKQTYAHLWVNMVFTRPIDTLYIRLKNSDNEFSRALLEISKLCSDSVEIIY